MGKHNTTKSSSNAEFSAQYKHPNWQKKRLEILEKDGYSCQMCGDKENTLHVHHCIYIRGRKVWEYDRLELITLCASCHDKIHKVKDDINHHILPMLYFSLREKRFNIVDMLDLMTGVIYQDEMFDTICKSLAEKVRETNEKYVTLRETAEED